MAQTKILIIDDTKIVGIALKAVFSEKGYSVDIALNGDDALVLVRSARYDLALIDLVMPGKDGIETCKGIKEENPDTECVLMTGYLDKNLSEKEEEFVRAGGKLCGLYKPFSGEKVIDEVKKILQDRAA